MTTWIECKSLTRGRLSINTPHGCGQCCSHDGGAPREHPGASGHAHAAAQPARLTHLELHHQQRAPAATALVSRDQTRPTRSVHNSDYEIERNPLLAEVFPIFFADHPVELYDEYKGPKPKLSKKDFDNLPFASCPQKRLAVLANKASWRRMAVAYPVGVGGIGTLTTDFHFGSRTKEFYVTRQYSALGTICMGHLYDVVVELTIEEGECFRWQLAWDLPRLVPVRLQQIGICTKFIENATEDEVRNLVPTATTRRNNAGERLIPDMIFGSSTRGQTRLWLNAARNDSVPFFWDDPEWATKFRYINTRRRLRNPFHHSILTCDHTKHA